MPFEPQREHEIVDFVFSLAKKQADYATLIADVSLTNRIRGLGYTPVGIRKQFQSTAVRVGREFPTGRVEIARDLTLTRTFELSSQLAGYLAAFALGGVVTTGTGPYTHTCKFSNAATSKQVPVATYYEELWNQAAVKRKYHAMAIDSVSFQGRNREICTATASWVGSGQHTPGAVTVPAETAQTLIAMDSAVFKYGTQGAPATITERLIDWQVNISQGLDIQNSKRPGSGLYGSLMWMGTRRATFSATVFCDTASTDVYDAWLADTIRECSIKVVNGTHYAEFLFPGCKPDVEKVTVDGKLAYRIEGSAESVLSGAGGTPDEAIQIVVVNDVTAYLGV